MTTTSTRLPAGPDAPRPQNGDPMATTPDTGDRHDPAVFAISTLPLLLVLCLGSVLFWLFAAACGAGDDTPADTGAQDPGQAAEQTAPPTTAPPPATTADNPAPGEPGYDPYLDPCSDVNTAHSRRRAAEARALMDAAETGGPPDPGVAGQVADIRREIGWDRDCEGVWGAEDDDRLEALERAAETPPDEEAADGEAASPETGDGETPDGTAAPPATDDGHDHADNDGHDHGPAPDDPEWVDTAPTVPPAPPADQLSAPITLPKTGLRPIAEVRPYVCDYRPSRCTGGVSERWTWEPVRLAVGSRWDVPSTGEIDVSQEVPPGSGDFEVGFDAAYFYTVTGFEPSDPGAGGIIYIDVLMVEETASKWGWRFADGSTWDCIPDGAEHERCGRSNPTNRALGALILPEDAGGIERDGAGNVTAATVLLLWPSPPPAGG